MPLDAPVHLVALDMSLMLCSCGNLPNPVLFQCRNIYQCLRRTLEICKFVELELRTSAFCCLRGCEYLFASCASSISSFDFSSVYPTGVSMSMSTAMALAMRVMDEVRSFKFECENPAPLMWDRVRQVGAEKLFRRRAPGRMSNTPNVTDIHVTSTA